MNLASMQEAEVTSPVPSFFMRMKKAVPALAILFRDPGRLDQVLVFAQAVNARTISRAIERVQQMPGGAELLAQRRRIDRTHVDYDALERLPDGTLGREYTRFLRD